MAFLLSLLFPLCLPAFQIGHLPVPAYSSLLSTLLSPLTPPPSYTNSPTYPSLESCLTQLCDFVLVPSTELQFFAGPVTGAVFKERLVTVVRDERGRYVKEVLWEFLVLLATIWMPGVMIVSQVVYFVEIRKKGKPSYVYGSLLACWFTFNLSKSKRDSTKLILALSWLFLAFLLLLIFLDLASVHSSLNADTALNSSAFYSQKVCTTEDEDCDLAVFGRMELAWASPAEDDERNLIYQEFLAGEISFHLVTLYSSAAADRVPEVSSEIAKLWKSGYIPATLHSQPAPSHPSSYNRSPLLLSSPEAVFTGLSILLAFILVFLVLAIKDLALRKERAVQTKIPETRPLKQESPMVPRSGNTLSLGSFSPKDGAGRPGEDWMQAVPVDDAHVQGIQNIQEYENELSAVPQANPSLGVSDSVFSLFKVEKKK